MNLQGGMSPKLKQILPGANVKHRQVERRKIGSLSSQVVEQKTKQRYVDSFQKFLQFHRLNSSFALPEAATFDTMVAEYVEFLWDSGAPKSEASYAAASIQFFRPQSKGHLAWSWKLIKTWNRIELPCRATPLSPEILASLAGQCFKWKQDAMAWLLVVGFSMFLRTGEILNLRRKDVVLPTQTSSEVVLLLENTKTTQKNFMPLEKLVVDEEICKSALRQLCQGKLPGDWLCPFSNYRFRSLWSSLIHHFGLEALGYMPYSLRRGGATSAYQRGCSLDVLVTKGRWQHVATARLYLDQGLQTLTQLTLPQASQLRLLQARQHFYAVSQSGTRGTKKRRRT